MSVQGELFSTAALECKPPAAPGFTLRPEFISPEEERSLLDCVENGPWETDWRRRIQQYGLGYAGGSNKAKWVRDFPEWLLPLARRVSLAASLPRLAENCVINEYLPPLGIAPHRDYAAFGETIACVSLQSDVLLDLIRCDGSARLSIDVPARSLWIMSGEVRSEWLHGIAPRLNDVIAGVRRKRGRRVSITFRTAK